MSDDPKLSQRYRELPREEPPRRLDDAILAKARRAVRARPAPLVAPSGRRRWYVPVAAAAIIVLAVAVTLHVERERPDPEMVASPTTSPAPREEPRAMPTQPPAAGPAPAPAPARKAAPEPPAMKGFAPDPKPQAAPAPALATPPLADSAAQGREEYERRAAAAERARVHAELQLSRADSGEESRRLRSAAAEAPAQRERVEVAKQRPAAAVSSLGATGYQSPEQWLLGIQDLKRQGRDEEAEKQLAEFRKRYPDYRIPEAILQKFEK